MSKIEGILIRDFSKSDLDELLDIVPKCFAREFEISGFDPDHLREMVNRGYGTLGRLFIGSLRLLGKEPIKFLVAEAAGKAIGTTMVNFQGTVGYISAVMVSPDYQRRGIATALMRDAVGYIQKRKMKRAVLNVVSTNTPAKAIYSGLGFKEFQQVAYLAADTGSIIPSVGADALETRPYREADEDEVYSLYMASDDPNRLRVYEFAKKDLRTPFSARLFSSGTNMRIVALRSGKIVGNVVASYTTAKEAGSIRSLHVRPEDRSQGIEKALLNAAIKGIRKSRAGRIIAMVPTTRPELTEILNGMGFSEAMVLIEMSKENAV